MDFIEPDLGVGSSSFTDQTDFFLNHSLQNSSSLIKLDGHKFQLLAEILHLI